MVESHYENNRFDNKKIVLLRPFALPLGLEPRTL
jgi:hypothetical protein